MEKIIEVKGLKKSFKIEHVFSEEKDTVKAVDGVCFTLFKGKVLAVVGESGSGKTTIARCICGLETQDSGEIFFEGKPIDFKNPYTRRKIQYIFQDTFASLNPRIKISDALSEPINFHFKLKDEQLETEVKRYLGLVGLPVSILKKYPHELSGGQRQRAVVARALTMKPEVLVADEPVSSLDVSVQAQILELFSRLNKEGKILIIFITHDLRVVKNIADEMIVLNKGKIVEEGQVSDIYKKPLNDYTKLLLASIPDSPYKFDKTHLE